ncbi:hypothetical protein NQZ68_017747 [Dissostichus eleginoides]|nr:hypothetical protein NQZ68_017747 [Dissostichus eleginoides]
MKRKHLCCQTAKEQFPICTPAKMLERKCNSKTQRLLRRTPSSISFSPTIRRGVEDRAH